MCHYGPNYNIYSDGLIYPKEKNNARHLLELLHWACEKHEVLGRQDDILEEKYILEHFVDNSNKTLSMHWLHFHIYAAGWMRWDKKKDRRNFCSWEDGGMPWIVGHMPAPLQVHSRATHCVDSPLYFQLYFICFCLFKI